MRLSEYRACSMGLVIALLLCGKTASILYVGRQRRSSIQKRMAKRKKYTSPELTSYLVSIALNSGNAFPEAVDRLQNFMAPRKDAYREIREIDRAGVIQTYPEATLKLLDSAVHEDMHGSGSHLREILNKIINADENLGDEPEFFSLYQAAERS